jgi:hypothetical protein
MHDNYTTPDCSAWSVAPKFPDMPSPGRSHSGLRRAGRHFRKASQQTVASVAVASVCCTSFDRRLCCCRMLAKLPRLGELVVSNATVPHPLPAPPPMRLRPLLRALTSVQVVPPHSALDAHHFPPGGSIAALHLLARWTRVADAGVQLDAADIMTETVAVRDWSLGWLRSVLALDGRLRGDAKAAAGYDHPSGYALVDDADVGLLGAAFAALSSTFKGCSFPVTLFLGQAVRSDSLRHLQLAFVSGLTVHDLHADDMGEHVTGWTGNLTVAPAHVKALVSGAAGLRELSIDTATGLDDASLWGLSVACPQLEELTLWDVVKVTAAGLLPLLTTHRGLRQVELIMSDVGGANAAAGIVASIKRLYPSVESAWHVTILAGGQLTMQKLPDLLLGA